MTDDTPKPVNRGLLAALLSDEKPWSWHWKYNFNFKDHMHALGVIAANYNDLEGHFYRLFCLTLPNFNVANMIFARMHNGERMAIALEVSKKEKPEFRLRYEAFIAAYGTATENRNILLHSKAHNASPLDLSALGTSQLILAKPSKKSPNENSFVSLSVADLREIADDMAECSNFGWQLFYWRYASLTGGTITWNDGSTATPPLPEIPREPRKLVLSAQPDQGDVPPQLLPSGE
jgi:hypothetical protein